MFWWHTYSIFLFSCSNKFLYLKTKGDVGTFPSRYCSDCWLNAIIIIVLNIVLYASFLITQVLFHAVGWFIGLLIQSKLSESLCFPVCDWISESLCFPVCDWNYKWATHLVLYVYHFTYSIGEIENTSLSVNVYAVTILSIKVATLEFAMVDVDPFYLQISCCFLQGSCLDFYHAQPQFSYVFLGLVPLSILHLFAYSWRYRHPDSWAAEGAECV